MSLLHRYLLRQNLFLILTVLAAGTSIYLLTDLFERMDVFLGSGLGLGQILLYFLYKLPAVISQILPAVFLLALVLQLNILDRSNELVAMEAGGISPLVVARFILTYGLIWAVAQLFFAQVAGAEGERASARMWQEQVRGKDLSLRAVEGLWFSEGDQIFHLNKAYPNLGRGDGLIMYRLDHSGLNIEEIIRAREFTIEKNHWRLDDVLRILPGTYTTESLKELDLPLRQNLKAFATVETTAHPTELPLWELSQLIQHLERSGSNVESLRTAWHSKLSYAASIVLMGLTALVISRFTSNIYKSVGLALICTFFFYSLTTWCEALGSRGILPPVIAAWMGVVGPLLVCLALLFKPHIPQSTR